MNGGTCSLGSNWITTNVNPQTAWNAAFHDAPGCVTDSYLDTPSIFIPATVYPSLMYFAHKYDLENGHDGGVLELSIDGGPFTDIVAAGGTFINATGYTGTISTAFLSPIAGRQAWTGTTSVFTGAVLLLPMSTRGHNVVFRFRLATDCAVGRVGWFVASLEINHPDDPTPTVTATFTPTSTATPSTSPSSSPSPTPSIGTSPTPSPTTTPAVSPTATPCGTVIFSENFDELPVGTPGPYCYISNVDPDSPPNDLFCPDLDGISNLVYDLPGVAIPTTTAVLRFRNNFNTDMSGGVFWDGSVLEVSSPNISGGDFLDITDSHVDATFLTGGYTGVISGDSENPLAGRMAWAGDSHGYIDTVIRLGPNLAGQQVIFRFRFGSDAAIGAPGWRIDTIEITDGVCPTPTPTVSVPPTATPSPSAIPSCPPVITQSSSQDITTTVPPCAYSPPMSGQQDNHYWRAFSMPSYVGTAPYYINSVSFGVYALNEYQPVVVRLYTNNGDPFPGGTWTLIGSSTVIVTADNSLVTTPLIATVPAGTSELIMELFAPDGSARGYFFEVGANSDSETSPSYWSCLSDPPAITTTHLVFNVYGSCGEPSPTPTLTPSPAPAQSLNLSTRLHVGTGDDIAVAGFIIGRGDAGKRVLVRGIGPSLTAFGIPDALGDTTLELHGFNGLLLLANDNWRDTQESELIGTGIPPTDNLESAIVATVQPSQYTAVLAGKNNRQGVGLVELYDLSPSGSQLLNVSTRALVGVADNVAIAGFILGPGNNPNIVIRGIGPSLSASGIPNPLADPTLELRNSSGDLLAANDNCAGSTIPPTNPLESCIEMPLQPGLYTAILAGNHGGTGVGLVEIYNLQ
jgi:hypothetical protein